jgi:endonuclease/exonuclease/phosphatase family metal-dependent hydrolase
MFLSGGILEIQVMSYNIRYGSAHDGKRRWKNRRPLLVELLRMQKPDMIGVQEALRFQLDEIRNDISNLGEIGAGRDNGKTLGEYAAILYRTDRFDVAESGTFWFSSTPDTAGSKSWGNRIPRVCSWALLLDKNTKSGIYLYNMHLDHRSQYSREKSIELLIDKITGRTFKWPVILTGDFNVIERNPVIRILKGLKPVDNFGFVPFVDAYRKIHPKAFGGTYNFFCGFRFGPRIDYVFTSPDILVTDANILRNSFDGIYPSDHFPVFVKLLASTGKK